jgi:hypothetical protein
MINSIIEVVLEYWWHVEGRRGTEFVLNNVSTFFSYLGALGRGGNWGGRALQLEESTVKDIRYDATHGEWGET